MSAGDETVGPLLDAVSSGHLRLEPAVAEACTFACDDLLDSLDDLQIASDWMSTKSAYGTLASARTLGGKFEQKAVGDGGFSQVIGRHATVIMELRDLFEKAGRAYREADARAAEMVASTTGGA